MERFNQDKWKYFDYDTSKYNFKELLCELFGRDDLENMHDSVNYPELFNMKTEQRNIDFTAYYKYNKDNVNFKVYAEKRTGGFEELNAGVSIGYKF